MQQALEALQYGKPNKAITILREALEQPEQEPVAKLFGTLPVYTTPPAAQPEQWDKTSASFNDWWDSYHSDPANPFEKGSAAYWAWSGWKTAQRQWQGLTPEEVKHLYPYGRSVWGKETYEAIEKALREKNDH